MTYLAEDENGTLELLEHERLARLDKTARSFILWKALEMNGQELQYTAKGKFVAQKQNWISVLTEAGIKTAEKQLHDYLAELFERELRPNILGNEPSEPIGR